MIGKAQKLYNGLLIGILSVMQVACTSSADSDLTRYINEIKARKARPIEPLPQFAPLPKFAFPDPDNRRSPFKPKEVEEVADKFAPNTNRPKQKLEFFPLDSLKFVGILKQDSNIWALITQPNGEVVRVKPGDYMGQNFGKIISINQKEIKLEESTQVAGKWKKQITTINLNARE